MKSDGNNAVFTFDSQPSKQREDPPAQRQSSRLEEILAGAEVKKPKKDLSKAPLDS